MPPLVEFVVYCPRALRLEEVTGCWQARGQCAALCWLLGSAVPTPITQRVGAVTQAAARLESRLALCAAAGQLSEVDCERARFGIPSMRIVEGSAWWAHGVWRTLSWLLGERPDPPFQLPVLAEDGSVCPGTEVYAVPRNPDAPWWRAMEAGREQRELAEASRWWRESHSVARGTGRG